jgi:hypothetical protein
MVFVCCREEKSSVISFLFHFLSNPQRGYMEEKSPCIGGSRQSKGGKKT